MSRMFSKKVYIHPDAPRKFWHKEDMLGWCEDHQADKKLIEVYDSVAEYNRWVQLLNMQHVGLISELRRQVTYELTPAAYERQLVRYKRVKHWFVPLPEEHNLYMCGTKKAAYQYCRQHGLKMTSVFSQDVDEPVYKDVCVEKASEYTADFVYKDSEGNEVVEDCKSEFTRKEKDYVLRRKMMLYFHKIKIFEYISK